ncbi:hypothetical protein C8R43DRAFT_557806 [Mycena crocata]|nr:hypothetical protein C8R43DRAFT_557806 [Mycena crocata]
MIPSTPSSSSPTRAHFLPHHLPSDSSGRSVLPPHTIVRNGIARYNPPSEYALPATFSPAPAADPIATRQALVSGNQTSSSPYYRSLGNAPVTTSMQVPAAAAGSAETSSGNAPITLSVASGSVIPSTTAEPTQGQGSAYYRERSPSPPYGNPLRHTCCNCHTTDSRAWRRSVLTPGEYVCNKCGLFERSHSRPRPTEFSPRKRPRTEKTSPTTPSDTAPAANTAIESVNTPANTSPDAP